MCGPIDVRLAAHADWHSGCCCPDLLMTGTTFAARENLLAQRRQLQKKIGQNLQYCCHWMIAALAHVVARGTQL